MIIAVRNSYHLLRPWKQKEKNRVLNLEACGCGSVELRPLKECDLDAAGTSEKMQ